MIWIVVLLGLILRLISLNQSFWLDEATSGVVVRGLSFGKIITQYLPGDFHPPGYYFILKGWSSVFGTSEVGLRSLSVVAGVAGIFVLYLVIKELFNMRIALLASWCLSTSGLHIYFSQEARMYILASLFVLLAIFFFVKTESSSRVGKWLGFGIFTALAIFTHYLTLLMLPVFLIWGIRAKNNFSWWMKYITSHIILIVGWIVWWPVFWRQLSSGLAVKTTSPLWWKMLGQSGLKDILLVPVKFMIGRISFENQYVYVLIVTLSGMLFGYLLVRTIKKVSSVKSLSLIWWWLVIPLVLGIVIGFKISILSYFRFLFILPAFYSLVAIGLTDLKPRSRPLFFILVLGVNLSTSFYYLLNTQFHRENWRGLVGDVRERVGSQKVVVVFPADSQKEAFRYYDPKGEVVVAGPNQIPAGYGIIWLMRYLQPAFDAEDKTRQMVEGMGYIKTTERNYRGVEVWEYRL